MTTAQTNRSKALEHLRTAVLAILGEHNLRGKEMGWVDSDDAFADWYASISGKGTDYTPLDLATLHAYTMLLDAQAFWPDTF